MTRNRNNGARKGVSSKDGGAEPGARAAASLAAGEVQTVLLAVTGMSPAVLTETVWALAQEDPPVIPDRVAAVTTISGRQAIERELHMAPEPGGLDLWQQLRLAVLGGGAASQNRLILEPAHLIAAPNSRTGRADWLEDLRTPEENRATSDFLLAEVRRWTESPGTRLVVSIAGGRKTMGALLYGCMTLLGRETDRLTHVLVNEPFDDPRLKPRFYFPCQRSTHLQDAEGRQWNAADAMIQLADVPFVPIRNLFERDVVRKPVTFLELVKRCRTKIEEIARRDVRISMKASRPVVAINKVQVKLSPLQCLVLLFLARNAREGRLAPPKYEAAVKELEEFGRQLKSRCIVEDGNDWRDGAAAPKDFDDQRLRKVLDEIRTKLRSAGPAAAALVPLLPQKGRFTLDLPASAITLEGLG